MKKLIIGLFIFVFLAVGSQVHANGASLVVTSPNNGGESLEAGGRIEIRWMSPNITSALNEVYISDGIHKGHTETVRMENNQGSIIYTLDSNLIPGSNYRAYVSIAYGSAISASDSSDFPFTIKPTSITINPVNTCIDSDDGYDKYTKGTLVWTTQDAGVLTNVDYCTNQTTQATTMTEYGCVDNKSVSKVYDCSNGCNNGACIKEKTVTIDMGCQTGAIFSSTTGAKCPATAAKITPTSDLTPRISYWQGKVNQHVSASEGMWQTDPDGVSGAEIDKLTYCRKWYPNTASVVDYKNETINAWHDRGNVNDYMNIRLSYRCVEPTVDLGCIDGQNYSSTTGQKCYIATPSITVLSPNGGETYTAGQQIKVTWKSENFSSSYNVVIQLMDDVSKIDYKDNGRQLFTLNDGEALFTIPLDSLEGAKLISGKRYKIGIWSGMNEGYPNPSADWSDNLFTINLSTAIDIGCSDGVIFSRITGQRCTDPSVTLLTPNGGEKIYKGNTIRIKWSSLNISKIYLKLYKGGDIYYDPYISPESTISLSPISASTGYFDWLVPNSLPDGTDYSIKVANADSGTLSDFSDNSFTITSSSADTGCLNGAIFSFITGQRCIEKHEERNTGCIDGQNYSSTTGKSCALGLYKKENTEVVNNENDTSLITTPIKRTLKRGVKGDDVKTLQEFLELYADGVFGRGTMAKVKEWQLENGLNPDGAFGRMSRQKAGLE